MSIEFWITTLVDLLKDSKWVIFWLILAWLFRQPLKALLVATTELVSRIRGARIRGGEITAEVEFGGEVRELPKPKEP